MARPVTLFTGKGADLPLVELAPLAKDMGYDGLELACWGDHFEVDRAIEDDGYAERQREILERNGLECFAIGNHLVGQAVCDPIDERHRATLPPHVWVDGDPEGVRQRAAEEMKNTARAAARLGVGVVMGFTGSSVWHKLYHFPPTLQEEVDEVYRDFTERWNPILDVFDEEGMRFAFEVHPTEIPYDIHSTERALGVIGRREAFGFNFDPSHLYWQFVDPVKFIDRFADRIYHVHMQDATRSLYGESGILSSHLPFGDHRRGWDFRSVGRGDVDFEAVIRALNRIGYDGPLSVEWEDAGMDRVHGARESAAFVRRADFEPSAAAFDAVFGRE
jgi:sugar phosphate isomerase/epimerase